MLLVIDAGNSSISLGLFKTPDVGAPDGNHRAGVLLCFGMSKLPLIPQRSADEYRLTLGLLLRDGGYSPADVGRRGAWFRSACPDAHTPGSARTALPRVGRNTGSASHGKCRNTHGACPSGERPRPAGREIS